MAGPHREEPRFTESNRAPNFVSDFPPPPDLRSRFDDHRGPPEPSPERLNSANVNAASTAGPKRPGGVFDLRDKLSSRKSAQNSGPDVQRGGEKRPGNFVMDDPGRFKNHRLDEFRPIS